MTEPGEISNDPQNSSARRSSFRVSRRRLAGFTAVGALAWAFGGGDRRRRVPSTGSLALDLGTAVLKFGRDGRVMSLRVADGDELISTPVPFCRLITATATLDSMSVTRSGEQLTFGFDQGVRLTYRLSIGRGVIVKSCGLVD